MSRPSVVVHGHFYQPPRLDPFSGTMPVDRTAAPARDWNSRISAECYRPNARLGNLGAMSWDLGPTLADWLARPDGDPVAYRGWLEGDRGRQGLAQPYHHTILPLASMADRRTEIRWGIRDFEVRFGRRPRGMWLPETAVDRETVRMLVDHGIDHTILAPWQVGRHDGLDTRRPARIELGDGRSIVVGVYDGLLSAALSFEPDATVDADAFVRDRLRPRWQAPGLPDGTPPLVLLATDGELYGHHQPGREHFVARLVGATTPPDAPYDRPDLAAALDRAAAAPDGLPTAHLVERTSWSCHHGITRWAAACACVPDGSWKAGLRLAFERLAGAIDASTDAVLSELPGSPDPGAARDGYVDVLLGVTSPETWAATVLDSPPSRSGRRAGDRDRDVRRLLTVMEAQRWRLAMFASCSWFWDTPSRPETASALRAAVRAARLIDDLTGTDLEARLVDDLRAIDPAGAAGAAGRVTLIGSALGAVGADAKGPGNPSARGLRATG